MAEAPTTAPLNDPLSEEWVQLTKCALEPPTNDRVLGYHHPDIRMRLAYHFIVNCCVYSGGEAVAEGEQAAVAAVTADDSNATDKVIAIEMGPGNRVKAGHNDQVYMIYGAGYTSTGEWVLLGMPRKDQGTRSRAKVQLNKELEQIIPSEITAFANMGEEGEKKAVIAWLRTDCAFKSIEDPCAAIESFRTLRANGDNEGLINYRKKFNATVFTAVLLSAKVFAENSPASKKKKEQVALLRDLEEAILQGNLNESHALITTLRVDDDGLLIEKLCKFMHKDVIIMALPEIGSATVDAMKQFFTTRRKAIEATKEKSKSTATQNHGGKRGGGGGSGGGGGGGDDGGDSSDDEAKTLQPPIGWPESYMDMIKKTAQHAKEKGRLDDPKNNKYSYWKNREKGHKLKGRRSGSEQGVDFAAAGETLKEEPTHVIERANAKMELSEAALGDVQAELGKAKTISDKLSDEQTILKRKVNELEEENRLLKLHGLHYADRCTGKHQRIADANADLRETHSMSARVYEGPSPYKESFEKYKSSTNF